MAPLDAADGVICFCTLIQFCPQTRVGHLLSIAVKRGLGRRGLWWGKELAGPPVDVITVQRHPDEHTYPHSLHKPWSVIQILVLMFLIY